MVNISSVMQIYRTEKRGKKVTRVEVENQFSGCRIMVLQGGTYQIGRSAEKCKRRKKNPGYFFWFDYIMLVPLIYEYDILNAYSSDCCDFMREI